MPDSVRGNQRLDDRELPASGEFGALLLAKEAVGANLSNHSESRRVPTLEARVGRLHARYRLALEARRPPQAVGEVRGGRDQRAITPVSVIARMARLAGLATVSDSQPPQVIRNTFAIRGLAPALDGLTLAHISDLHLDLCGQACTDSLADAVATHASHALVITGDLFTSALKPPRSDAALKALDRVLESHGGPAFAVLGDEDSLWMVPRLEQLGLRVLVNESIALTHGEDRLYLAGVDDPAYFKADDVDAALQSIPAGATSVLLAHSPDVYRRAAGAGFDAMLCGHTHGGQLCLPNGRPLVRAGGSPSSICRGSWRHEGLLGYTSSGCGTTPLKLRWNCPAEVAFHRFTREDDNKT